MTILHAMDMKKCTKCGGEKGAAEFSKGKAECKSCLAKRMADYRNKKKVAALETPPIDILTRQVNAILGELNPTDTREKLITDFSQKLSAAGIITKLIDVPRFPVSEITIIDEGDEYLLIDTDKRTYIICSAGKYIKEIQEKYPGNKLIQKSTKLQYLFENKYTAIEYEPPSLIATRKQRADEMNRMIAAEDEKKRQRWETITSLCVDISKLELKAKYLIWSDELKFYSSNLYGFYIRAYIADRHGLRAVNQENSAIVIEHIKNTHRDLTERLNKQMIDVIKAKQNVQVKQLDQNAPAQLEDTPPERMPTPTPDDIKSIAPFIGKFDADTEYALIDFANMQACISDGFDLRAFTKTDELPFPVFEMSDSIRTLLTAGTLKKMPFPKTRAQIEMEQNEKIRQQERAEIEKQTAAEIKLKRQIWIAEAEKEWDEEHKHDPIEC